MFAGDCQSIRRFAERDHANIVCWNSHDPEIPAGGPHDARGHYAAHEATDVLVGDLRRFVTALT
ncbi:hypothetical protein AB0I55_02840 [Actinocatenispora sera]|uniref:hypothetical protein n=1 Tax=Actinocatenispora sera TaxID=390989 RepID=UPI0033F39EF6